MNMRFAWLLVSNLGTGGLTLATRGAGAIVCVGVCFMVFVCVCVCVCVFVRWLLVSRSACARQICAGAAANAHMQHNVVLVQAPGGELAPSIGQAPIQTTMRKY